jgi:hypothetical protein
VTTGYGSSSINTRSQHKHTRQLGESELESNVGYKLKCPKQDLASEVQKSEQGTKLNERHKPRMSCTAKQWERLEPRASRHGPRNRPAEARAQPPVETQDTRRAADRAARAKHKKGQCQIIWYDPHSQEETPGTIMIMKQHQLAAEIKGHEPWTVTPDATWRILQEEDKYSALDVSSCM